MCSSDLLILVDIYNSIGINGKEAENLLHEINITCNKNTIPNETLPPMISSGIRLGSPAMTTRGLKEKDFTLIAHLIDDCLRKTSSKKTIKEKVKEITEKYPLWY